MVTEFFIGFGTGILSMVALSGAVGWWMAKHPRYLVRKMMGKAK
jgi:hypothetical protein